MRSFKIALLITLFILSLLILGYLYLVYFDSLPETVAPDVTGLPLEAAREKIEGLGLRAREAGTIFEAKFPEGCVVTQRPEGGRRVKEGRMINLIISSGKRKVPVPSLTGRRLNQANEVLAAAELQLGDIRFEKNASAAEGIVLAQEPLAGEEIGADSRVDVLVATTREVETTEGTE